MDEQPLPPPGDSAPEPPAPAEPPAPSGWIPPSPGPKPSRVLPAILAVGALGVLGVLALLAFIGANVDPRDAAASDFGRRLMEMPEFEARYGDVDSVEEAYRLGQEAGLTAFARLDDASLLRYWQLMDQVIEGADDRACAGLIRQTLDAAEATEMTRLLDEDQFEELLGISFRAFEADLKGIAGPPPPSDAQVQSASAALASAMGIDRLNEAASALQDPAADDATVCRATKAFIGGVLDLEDPHRATFLRYMASP
jgi:hypothetical protein